MADDAAVFFECRIRNFFNFHLSTKSFLFAVLFLFHPFRNLPRRRHYSICAGIFRAAVIIPSVPESSAPPYFITSNTDFIAG